ncbi:MAG TPA: hypothetical protein EYP98_00025, partial [Planctomycetes bacterium]|nr:hypothetical protein [Planctomycetota bacterium]
MFHGLKISSLFKSDKQIGTVSHRCVYRWTPLNGGSRAAAIFCGCGAAAAMAGCMGTSLFLMTVRFSQGKKANVDREDDLAKVEALLQDHLGRLMPMAERDCKSFDLVSVAYGMAKETDEQ